MSEEELIDMLYSKFCNEDDDYDLRYTDIIYNSIEELEKEIERLNNIIDELVKYIKFHHEHLGKDEKAYIDIDGILNIIYKEEQTNEK